jgi:hypothetical protein
MSDDNTAPASPNGYDTQLSELYGDKPAPNLSHLLGITAEHHPEGVVTDRDYDRLVAERAAAQRAPASTPSAPAVKPNTTALDLSSARSPTGERISDPSLLTGDSIVTFQGMECSVGSLMTMGLVARDASGQYVTTNTGEAPSQEARADTAPPNQPLDPHSEAIMAEAQAKAMPQLLGAATSFIQSDGVLSEEAVSQLASAMGIEPSAVREQATHVQQAYAKEAVQMAVKATECPEKIAADALAHASKNQQSAFREASQRHFSEGRADWGPLVMDYLANLDQVDPNQILNAGPVKGRSVHWDRGARCVVVTLGDGTQMSWAAAVRGKFISL